MTAKNYITAAERQRSMDNILANQIWLKLHSADIKNWLQQL